MFYNVEQYFYLIIVIKMYTLTFLYTENNYNQLKL